MIFIQIIKSEWTAKTRGNIFASEREKNHKFQLINSEDNFKNPKIICHSVSFSYDKNNNTIKSEKIYLKNEIPKLRCTDISYSDNELKVKFCCDSTKTDELLPFRRGHNEDFNNINSKFYMRDIVNETAFILKNNEYGRIVFNGRCRSRDEFSYWYYQMFTYNIINTDSLDFNKNIFQDTALDYEYKQLAKLYY